MMITLGPAKVHRVIRVRFKLKLSDAFAAMIGIQQVAGLQVIKKLRDYIKAQNLQDPTNKRSINAAAKLLPVFGKPRVTIFELAGIVGRHLS
jgi:DNA topoisomerase-3